MSSFAQLDVIERVSKPSAGSGYLSLRTDHVYECGSRMELLRVGKNSLPPNDQGVGNANKKPE